MLVVVVRLYHPVVLQLASKLDAQVEALQRQPLGVMVQVRKRSVVRECLAIYQAVVHLCTHL